MDNFHQRKKARTEIYFRWVFGWKLKDCTACNGSGYYDHDGSPPCGACEGSGKEEYQGPKSLALNTKNEPVSAVNEEH